MPGPHGRLLKLDSLLALLVLARLGRLSHGPRGRFQRRCRCVERALKSLQLWVKLWLDFEARPAPSILHGGRIHHLLHQRLQARQLARGLLQRGQEALAQSLDRILMPASARLGVQGIAQKRRDAVEPQREAIEVDRVLQGGRAGAVKIFRQTPQFIGDFQHVRRALEPSSISSQAVAIARILHEEPHELLARADQRDLVQRVPDPPIQQLAAARAHLQQQQLRERLGSAGRRAGAGNDPQGPKRCVRNLHGFGAKIRSQN
eukprot:scaffold2930_cov244-Pinguiococcus_pyrenoidosus.AAC.11